MSRDDGRSPLLVGVDAGTSRLKALIFTPAGNVVAQGVSPTPIVSVTDGDEFDPEILWAAASVALCEAIGKIENRSRIRGIAVASVGESVIPLDAELRPVAPALAWYDQRPNLVVQDIARRVDVREIHMATGMPPYAIASVCKILWLKRQDPEAFSRTCHWLHVADYLAFRLCGVIATECSLAGRTAGFDLDALNWHGSLLAELEVDAATLPPVAENGVRLGCVTPEIAQQTGLPSDCVVSVGGHDHVIGALAAGIFNDNSLMDSMGTAEGLVMPLPSRTRDQRFVDWALEQTLIRFDGTSRYFFCSGLFTSSAAIEWFRGLFAAGIDYNEIMAEAANVPDGAEGTLFIPHLRMASPPDSYTKPGGAFLRMSTESSRPVLYRALLEGLAFDVRKIADLMMQILDEGDRAELCTSPITVIGGGSHNALWLDIKANVYGRPLRALHTREAVSLGAALLAGVAAGLFESVQAAVGSIALDHDVYAPTPERQARYGTLFGTDYQQALAATRLVRH